MTPEESHGDEHVAGAPHLPRQQLESGGHAGDVIDRYELVEAIGEGGMGTVWRAQQRVPIQRAVALKVIKLGMDTREVVARFEAERQVLALMDHPHIAKVHDGGSTPLGRPYFVMELVEGQPITKFCDANQLSLPARLELFQKVCMAIQHAHQKGIIHRDIKPSNVLIAASDEGPTPKIIDFGVAKATGARLTDKTVATNLGQILGTPEYMAPEQANPGEFDIDTRADVYALGALLYELLTGSKLFDLSKALSNGYSELMRTIREVDPERPSTRVSNLGQEGTTVAAHRRTDIEILRRGLSGDLDWIVMKALEKDRERRYESASSLAEDIRRFVQQEPVLAAPPSKLYRLGKFVRRRRGAVASFSVIGVLFIGGSIGTAVGLVKSSRANVNLSDALLEEERQRLLANQNEQRAIEAEADAREEAERAREAEAAELQRSEELERVVEFQAERLRLVDAPGMGVLQRQALLAAASEDNRESLLTGLSGVNFTSFALKTLEQSLFQDTLDAINQQFRSQPLVRARLLQSMATTLLEIGLLEMADAPQRTALSLREAELGPEHEDTFWSRSEFGRLLFERSMLAEAEALLHELVADSNRVLGQEHPCTLESTAILGMVLFARGDHAGAEPLYREVLETRQRVLGKDDPKTLESLNNMGYFFFNLARLDEAMTHHQEAYERRQRVLGDNHTKTLQSLDAVSTVLHSRGRMSEAETYLRRAVAARRVLNGDEHPDTFGTLRNLATLLSDIGELEEAEALHREVLSGLESILGRDHRSTQYSMSNLATTLLDRGKLVEAEHMTMEVLEIRLRTLGPDHLETVNAVNNLGSCMFAQGRLVLAADYFGDAFVRLTRLLGESSGRTQGVRASFEGVLARWMEEARASGNEGLLAEACARSGALRVFDGSYAEAEVRYEEAVGLLFGLDGDHPGKWIAMSGLASAIAGQGRWIEAEAVFIESAEGIIEERKHPIEPERPELHGIALEAPGAIAARDVVKHLVEFFETRSVSDPGAGHDKGAEEWRARLAEWDEG